MTEPAALLKTCPRSFQARASVSESVVFFFFFGGGWVGGVGTLKRSLQRDLGDKLNHAIKAFVPRMKRLNPTCRKPECARGFRALNPKP